jgi:hypothetical protein
MLILKRALEQCRIPQKTLVVATGLSKTQVSLSLNSGRLPKNAKPFVAGVNALAATSPALTEWLNMNGIMVEQLWQPEASPRVAVAPIIDTPAHILAMVGNSCLRDDVSIDEFLDLARVALHLYRNITLLAETDQLIDINCEVNKILTGGTPC